MTTPTEQDLRDELQDLVSAQPFQPDTSSVQRRGRALRRRGYAGRATAGVAVAALAALVAVTANGTTGHHGINKNLATGTANHRTNGSVATTPSTGTTPAAGPQHLLTQLASSITATAPATQAGDATLVERTQSYPDQSSIQGFDLYTDSGEYFYAPTESGLPLAIKSNDDQGGGMFAREIAAAEYAVNGNLAVADQRMADAPFADGRPPGSNGQTWAGQYAEKAQVQKLGATPEPVQKAQAGPFSFDADNYIWMDAEDALQAGSGNPQVRAGILRILSTLPGITVTDTEVGGQPALAITATGTPDLPANYHETITINASTGVPIGMVGGTNGAAPSVTVTYQVSRVTVSAIEAGQF